MEEETRPDAGLLAELSGEIRSADIGGYGSTCDSDEAAANVLAYLRSLPVEERMAAVGAGEIVDYLRRVIDLPENKGTAAPYLASDVLTRLGVEPPAWETWGSGELADAAAAAEHETIMREYAAEIERGAAKIGRGWATCHHLPAGREKK